MKVYRDLLKATSVGKNVNDVRYMLALRQLKNDGWVDVTEAKVFLSKLFRVSPKTVHNRLHLAVKAGYGNFDQHHSKFYYYSQIRMLDAMGGQLKSTVTVDVKDFSGSIATTRANFHAALLGAYQNEITVTRQTIINITGRAKRTQRNYEKIAGVKVVPNYARLVEYSGNKYDLDRVRYLGHAAFIMSFNGKPYITKQLANSYTLPFRKGTKKVKQPCIIVGGGNVNNGSKVYFTKLKDGIKEWQTQGKHCDAYVRNLDNTWEWLLGEPCV